MTSGLHAKLTGAARTAREIISRERAGDLPGIAGPASTASTASDGDKGFLCGAGPAWSVTRPPFR
jgi:hypothetical protein